MKDEYDFKNARSNPFTAQYKNELSIRVNDETLAFLKAQAVEKNIPFRSIASLFLDYCAKEHTELAVHTPVIIKES